MLSRLQRLLFGAAVDGHHIARAALLSSGLSAGVKGASLAKEILVAAYFGVSGQLDAYLIALMLIGIPHGVVVNSIQWTLVPEFIRAEAHRGRSSSRALLRQAVAVTAVILAGVLLVWIALIPSIAAYLTRDAGAEAFEAVRACFLVLCLYYFTSGVLLLGYAVLQAQKQFVANGAIPVVTPAIIAVLLVVVPVPQAETLAWGMSLGFAVELLLVEGLLRSQGLTLAPASPIGNAVDRKFLASVGRLAWGAAAVALIPLIEQAAAVQFGVGAVATLSYANKLPLLLSGLTVTAIAVAAFPYFSEMLARGELDKCRRTLHRYVAIVSVGGIAVASMLIVLSEPIVRLFFQRGAFTDSAAAGVVLAQQAYLVQIPGALVLALTSRLLLACRRSGIVTMVHVSQALLLSVAVLLGMRLSNVPAVVACAYSVAVTLTSFLAYVLATKSLSKASRERQ